MSVHGLSVPMTCEDPPIPVDDGGTVPTVGDARPGGAQFQRLSRAALERPRPWQALGGAHMMDATDPARISRTKTRRKTHCKRLARGQQIEKY